MKTLRSYYCAYCMAWMPPEWPHAYCKDCRSGVPIQCRICGKPLTHRGTICGACYDAKERKN